MLGYILSEYGTSEEVGRNASKVATKNEQLNNPRVSDTEDSI